MVTKKTFLTLFIMGSLPMFAQDTASFSMDASGNAQLIVIYPTLIKTSGTDGVSTFKKEKFTVKLGNLAIFPLSPQEVAQRIKDALVKKFKSMNDKDLLAHAGSSTFGRDVSKWSITLGGQPFESFSKSTALVNDVNKMKELYSKGLEAKYAENVVTPLSPMPSFAAEKSTPPAAQSIAPAETVPQQAAQPSVPASPSQGELPASFGAIPSYSSPQK